MIHGVSKITAVTAMVVMISSLAAFLAWGGIILIFFGGLIAAPFILIRAIRSKWDSRLSSAKSMWRSINRSKKLESLLEEVDSAAMVAHRNSTEVVYANKKAISLLGENLLGRTAYSEENLPSRPVRINQREISEQNHPALRMQEGSTKAINADVIWLTPEGTKKLEIKARRIFRKKRLDEDFVLYIMKDQETNTTGYNLSVGF